MNRKSLLAIKILPTVAAVAIIVTLVIIIVKYNQKSDRTETSTGVTSTVPTSDLSQTTSSSGSSETAGNEKTEYTDSRFTWDTGFGDCGTVNNEHYIAYTIDLPYRSEFEVYGLDYGIKQEGLPLVIIGAQRGDQEMYNMMNIPWSAPNTAYEIVDCYMEQIKTSLAAAFGAKNPIDIDIAVDCTEGFEIGSTGAVLFTGVLSVNREEPIKGNFAMVGTLVDSGIDTLMPVYADPEMREEVHYESTDSESIDAEIINQVEPDVMVPDIESMDSRYVAVYWLTTDIDFADFDMTALVKRMAESFVVTGRK